MFCEHCGNLLPENSKFCPTCGNSITVAASEQGTVEPAGLKPQKSKKKTAIIVSVAAGLVAALCAILIPVFVHNAKVTQYNEGVTCLENGGYEEAKAIFADLGDFEDSEMLEDFAQMQIDYLEIESLFNSGNYDRIIDILNTRSEFFGNNDAGKEAAELASEYKTLKTAVADMKAEKYSNAAAGFASLDKLHDRFLNQICLCDAYLAEQDQNWTEILINLYALQKNDPEKKFLENPVSEEDHLVADAVVSASYDPADLLDIIEPGSAEEEALKSTAEKGFKYTAAKEKLYYENYREAMDAFEELGDFLDSRDCYEEAKSGYEHYETIYLEAEDYYNNEEFYKAKQLFDSLSLHDYKDSEERAASCEQPLPENGALKFGNGSGVELTVKVPNQNESVLLKLYDSNGTTAGQVFVHPGKSATVKMKGGTYTIKAAYGTHWYGEIDLFGSYGNYQQLLNGYDAAFMLESGYAYTLTLGGYSDGNVGTRDIGDASGM